MSTRQKILFLLMLVLVTLLFFIHIPDGSFQARNGPTTPVDRVLGAALGWLLLLFNAEAIVGPPVSELQLLSVRSVQLHCTEFSLQSPALRC